MEIQRDFKELLELLNKHNVDYMIDGGYALAFHGAPRYTGDIDIVTSITGVDWRTAESNRVKGEYGEMPVYFIGRSDFIANKRSTGRHKDIADVEALGENEKQG